MSRAGSTRPPPGHVPPYLAAAVPPERTSDNYERIRTTVFAKACAGCHGDHGQGSKTAGAINDHAFLHLASDQSCGESSSPAERIGACPISPRPKGGPPISNH